MRNKLLFTPDFGESDAYHLNLSLKYYLAENLKANQLPFWTDKLQGGYPLFSEGQIGALFLPNIVFLKFFNFADGYNLLLVFSLFCLTVGFYFLLKEFKINSLIALLTSFIFTFNGAVSLRWVHLNLIQSFSLAPLLFWLILKYLNTQKKRYLFSAPLIISQMIFAGHTQVVFIVLFGIFLFYPAWVFLKSRNMKEVLRILLILIYVISSGIILSLSQMLPTYLLAKNSLRPLSLNFSTATSFPLSWAHLISFVSPFAFGNPKIGTYPAYSSDWGIFWENTPYLGLILIGLFLLLFITKLKLNLKNKPLVISLFIAGFLVLMALGKFSPLYLIYNFPPFSFFRTPSKYLLMANFFIVLASSLTLHTTWRKMDRLLLKSFLITILIVGLGQLLQLTFGYHLFVSSSQVLKKPEIVKNLNDSNLLEIGQNENWNSIFLKNGWAKESDKQKYLFFKNFLYPNSNLIYNVNIYDINTGTFRLKRPEYLRQFVLSNLEIVDDKVNLQDNNCHLLKLLGINNLISSIELKSDQFTPIASLKDGDTKISLYGQKDFNQSFYYVPNSIKKIIYLEDFNNLYEKNQLSEEASVSEDINKDIDDNNTGYQITKKSRDLYDYQLKGSFKKETMIVFRQNFFPEWSIYIDNQKTKAIRVNLTHIGISIPKGTHNITLKYENFYFKLGLGLSLLYLPLFLISIKKIKKNEE